MSITDQFHEQNAASAIGIKDTTITPRVAMVQGTARLHYALPVALQRAWILERVFTDFYVVPGSFTDRAARLAGRFRSSFLKRLGGRQSRELQGAKVCTNPWLGLRDYLSRPRGPVPTAHWIKVAKREGQWIRRRGLGNANALMGFITSIHPETFQHFRDAGIVTVGDQIGASIANAVHEARLQNERFPNWEPPAALEELQRFDEFVKRTWASLDHVTCASDYVRQGLIAQGLKSSNVSMIPYPFDVQSMPFVDRSNRTGPLTVGFVGTVNLNKGTPYFFEVAKRLSNRNVRFVMVGRNLLDQVKIEAHHGDVELIGPVPRSEVTRWLSLFDVFLFPATCEGSSGSVIEAMASGLPVVTSANSGTYARDGVEGFLRAYDNIEGLADCVARLLDDDTLRHTMGQAARQRVARFDLDHYSRQIAALFATLLNPPDR